MEAQMSLLGPSLPSTKSSKTQFNQASPFFFSSNKIQASERIALGTSFSYASWKLPIFARLKSKCCMENLQREIVEDSPDNVFPKVRRKKLAVFVSGGGSNFKSVHEATINGHVHGDISVLVTNKPGIHGFISDFHYLLEMFSSQALPLLTNQWNELECLFRQADCGGAQFARDKGIPVILFPKTKDGSGLSSKDLVAALRPYEIDFILLAGYLKRIPHELIVAYPRSILNIHPSLLPAFGGKGCYGIKVHQAVIASGARYSGATIHFVDEEYDTGRILAQTIVPVLANDTPEELAARILKEEHKLYVKVATALCEERIFWRQDGVPVIQSKEDPDHYM